MISNQATVDLDWNIVEKDLGVQVNDHLNFEHEINTRLLRSNFFTLPETARRIASIKLPERKITQPTV
jgi:hypothetical protein